MPEKVEPEDEDTPVEVVVRGASRFSKEFLATVISLTTTALGFVAALAWNSAMTRAFERLDKGDEIAALFIYAVAVTFVAVIVIVLLARLATRVGAPPVEFKFPTKQPEAPAK